MHRAEEEGEGSIVSAGGCCSPVLTTPQPRGQCMGTRRHVIVPHSIMLAENGIAPWAGVKTAPSEAGAHLGQSTSADPYYYSAGTFSRSVTRVLVVLREQKGQEGGEGWFALCLWVDIYKSLVIRRSIC